MGLGTRFRSKNYMFSWIWNAHSTRGWGGHGPKVMDGVIFGKRGGSSEVGIRVILLVVFSSKYGGGGEG